MIAQHSAVERVLNMITIQLGPDTMLALKVKMCPGRDIETVVESINALEKSLKQGIPRLAWCFVEPDIED